MYKLIQYSEDDDEEESFVPSDLSDPTYSCS